MKLNVSGKLYNVVGYQVRKEDYLRRHGSRWSASPRSTGRR